MVRQVEPRRRLGRWEVVPAALDARRRHRADRLKRAVPRRPPFDPRMAPEPPFTKSSTHPRAYGNFARVLGKYVRDDQVLTLPDAIRKLSALPAANLELDHRGFLRAGMYADVVVFDPAAIRDRATFENPHQYAVGVRDVFVNGRQVIKDGEHTGAKPGRALWGPGKVR